MKLQLLAAALVVAVTTPAFADAARGGHILTYTRSNTDGSDEETIHQYQPAPDLIWVNKRMEPCTRSAFVSAEIDMGAGEVRRIVSGALNRNGGQDAFGDIELDPESRTVALAMRLPQGEIRLSIHAADSPWMLFDFDLAELNAVLPLRNDWRSDFSFGMALLWTEGDPSEALRYLDDSTRGTSTTMSGTVASRIASKSAALRSTTLRAASSGLMLKAATFLKRASTGQTTPATGTFASCLSRKGPAVIGPGAS